MRCTRCGCEQKPDAKFCPNCGAPVFSGEKTIQILTIVLTLLLVSILTVVFIVSKGKGQGREETSGVRETFQSQDVTESTESVQSRDESSGREEETVCTASEEETSEPESSGTEESTSYSREVFSGNVTEEIARIKVLYQEVEGAVTSGAYEAVVLRDGVTGYYENGILKSVWIAGDTDQVPYSRFYYYDKDQLFFAYYKGDDAHRLYFCGENLIRWRYSADASKGQEAVNYDLEDSEEYRYWERTALSEGNSFLNK